MKEIKLTQGFVALVDDEDYEWLNQYKWQVAVFKNVKYARGNLHRNSENESKSILMHRMIMDAPIGSYIDHKDHDGLNNQKRNLRYCSVSQNQANRPKTHGISKYKGVHKCKKYQKWIAAITVNQKWCYIGTFWDEYSAALAYDKEAKKIYGEFARLNFE